MPIDNAVGIDVGITELVATSTGEVIGNPRHLRRSQRRLGDMQRLVDRRRRGSARRRQAAARVGRLHRRIARQRRNLAHQISRQLVNGTIVHESLEIPKLVRRPAPRLNEQGGFNPNGAAAKAGLNREILAAGWGQFLRYLTYKAEEAGREIIAVSPRHTDMSLVRARRSGQSPCNQFSMHTLRTRRPRRRQRSTQHPPGRAGPTP